MSIDVVLHRYLDLTSPAVQRKYGVTTAALTTDDHAECHRVADLARAHGCFALFVPSAAIPDARNIIIYPDVVPASDVVLTDGPDRVPL